MKFLAGHHFGYEFVDICVGRLVESIISLGRYVNLLSHTKRRGKNCPGVNAKDVPFATLMIHSLRVFKDGRQFANLSIRFKSSL